MINIRNYIPEDFAKIQALCFEHKINVPTKALVIVAEDDDKEEVQGFVGVTHEAFIEPLICENPLVAHTLYQEALKYLKQRGIKSVKLYCDKSKVKMFEKLGFREFEPGLIFMEKEIE